MNLDISILYLDNRTFLTCSSKQSDNLRFGSRGILASVLRRRQLLVQETDRTTVFQRFFLFFGPRMITARAPLHARGLGVRATSF